MGRRTRTCCRAGLLGAGLDGVARALDPGPRLDLDMYVAGTVAGARRLPLNLLDAIRALEGSPLGAALGASFAGSYAKLKRQERDGSMRHLTQWERDNTLDC